MHSSSMSSGSRTEERPHFAQATVESRLSTGVAELESSVARASVSQSPSPDAHRWSLSSGGRGVSRQSSGKHGCHAIVDGGRNVCPRLILRTGPRLRGPLSSKFPNPADGGERKFNRSIANNRRRNIQHSNNRNPVMWRWCVRDGLGGRLRQPWDSVGSSTRPRPAQCDARWLSSRHQAFRRDKAKRWFWKLPRDRPPE